MALRLVRLLIVVVALPTFPAAAEEWPRARISRLPDSAFAVVETVPGGRKLRQLPHHDETGAVDPAHVKAALARLSQVRWVDPANEAVARHHLEQHVRAGGEAVRPVDPRRR